MRKGRKSRTRGSPSKGVLATVVIVGVIVVGVYFFLRAPDEDGARILTPVSTFGDVHGLAVNPEDPAQLFVATHQGLMRGEDGTGWVRVGEARDDYMGFTMHPTDGDTFWTSGHPRRGGNIGVQQSTDGGHTWRVIALGGVVDFHALTVSPADPARLWGVYRGQLHGSADGGNSWTVVNAEPPPQLFTLAGDPKDADTVWGAGQAGVAKSSDGGRTWRTVTGASFQGIGLARDGTAIYVAGQGGAAKSTDGGATWVALALGAQGTPGHVAVDPSDADTVFVATYQGAIHRSTDGGVTWVELKGPG